MSESGNFFVAQTKGTYFTMYNVMRMMGIPLSDRQAQTQIYLESKYPPCYCPVVVVAWWNQKGDSLDFLMKVIEKVTEEYRLYDKKDTNNSHNTN